VSDLLKAGNSKGSPEIAGKWQEEVEKFFSFSVK